MSGTLEESCGERPPITSWRWESGTCGLLTRKQRKDFSMTTSKRVASKASKELRDKKSTKDQKSVAGSDLEQAKGKKKGKG